MGRAPHLLVEGYEDFQRTLRKQTGKLPKYIGEAHKEVGRFIIDKIPAGDPQAVGEGMGATPRASARKRDVNLIVGHSKREGKFAQWGKTEVQPFVSGRPYIVGIVLENQDEIMDEFLKQIGKCMDPAFYRVNT